MKFFDLIESNIWGIEILENYSFVDINKAKFIIYLKTQDVTKINDDGLIFDFSFIENKEEILNYCLTYYKEKNIEITQIYLNDLSENLDIFNKLAIRFLDTKFSIEYNNEQDLFVCENKNFDIENLIKNQQNICERYSVDTDEFNEKLLYCLFDEKYKISIDYDFKKGNITLSANSQNIKYFYKNSYSLNKLKLEQNEILNNFFLMINATEIEKRILVPFLLTRLNDVINQSDFYNDIEKDNEELSLSNDKKLTYCIKKYENNIKICLFFNNIDNHFVVINYIDAKNNLDKVSSEIFNLTEKIDFDISQYEIYETLNSALNEIELSLQQFNITIEYNFFDNIFYCNNSKYSPETLLNSTQEISKDLYQKQDENLKQKFSQQEIFDKLNNEILKTITTTFDIQIKKFNENKIIEMQGKISYSKMYKNRNILYNTKFVVDDFLNDISIDKNIKEYLKETLFFKLNNLKFCYN